MQIEKVFLLFTLNPYHAFGSDYRAGTYDRTTAAGAKVVISSRKAKACAAVASAIEEGGGTVLWLCNMVIPQMAARNDGVVIIVSSIGGLKGHAKLGAYPLNQLLLQWSLRL